MQPIEETIDLNDWDTMEENLSRFRLSAYLLHAMAIRADAGISFADATSKGQLLSKKWLIDTVELLEKPSYNPDPDSEVQDLPHPIFDDSFICVCGGWYGILPSLIFDRARPTHITSIDIDSASNCVATSLNGRRSNYGTFTTRTCDMYFHDYKLYDTIINTSFEHIAHINTWKHAISEKPGKYIIVQSNNFTSHVDHVNCCDSHDHLAEQLDFDTLLYRGTLTMPDYNRFMVIGKYNQLK